ncbi:hypothetical protein RRG08_006758 [Elysia crispata]|uniref:Uncharacterized protein n=1 Tax=Elysia crispata TaxID=231223 RepID=A0AAE0ZNU6_9GAST|nr:hypothetical protein RRG08_006758 [Elysia crispata]
MPRNSRWVIGETPARSGNSEGDISRGLNSGFDLYNGRPKIFKRGCFYVRGRLAQFWGKAGVMNEVFSAPTARGVIVRSINIEGDVIGAKVPRATSTLARLDSLKSKSAMFVF